VNTFQLGYKNQSIYAVSGTSRCLFWDKYKTHKYSVGRAYSCWMLTIYRRISDRFIWRPSPYRAVNTFQLGYKNQSIYAVSGTSRCLFSDKYKTHKYSVGRAYSCWVLNWWCITWPVGFKMVNIQQLYGLPTLYLCVLYLSENKQRLVSFIP